MNFSSRMGWPLAAVALLAMPVGASANDKDQFREATKALEASLRAAGEPKDHCSIGAYIMDDAVVGRVQPGSSLMPGDQVKSVDHLAIRAHQPEEVVAVLRDIGPTASIPVTVERAGKLVDIQVNCSNARPANEARLTILNLAARGRYDECVTAVSERSDMGTQGAYLKLQCASFSKSSEKYNVPELTFDATRMMIEDAHWVPGARPNALERLRVVEGSITRSLGAARFQELVAATRSWPGGEQMFESSRPDWALFRRNAEAALRARLIDPDSARIEWPYGFLLGTWRPLFSKRIDGYWTCGSINARNRMGGYTGNSTFVAVLDAGGAIQYVEIGQSKDVDLLTSQCNGSVKLLPPPPPELSGAMVAQQAPNSSIADELRKLADLKNSGALSEAEFQAAKQRLLGTGGR